jgi:hypothetical protein
MPSPQRQRRNGRGSAACPGVTPTREKRRATAKVFDSRRLREERTPALALRRSLIACATLAKKEDSASHARQPMRPCKREATTRDGTALPAQTERPAPRASPSCGITFDMSGDRRHAKHAVGRPLDGGVRSRRPKRHDSPFVHFCGGRYGGSCACHALNSCNCVSTPEGNVFSKPLRDCSATIRARRCQLTRKHSTSPDTTHLCSSRSGTDCTKAFLAEARLAPALYAPTTIAQNTTAATTEKRARRDMRDLTFDMSGGKKAQPF